MTIAAPRSAPLAIFVLAALGQLAAAAAEPPRQNAQGVIADDCFRELRLGTSTNLACAHPVRLTEKERADLRRVTRELLLDARCTVAVTIARQLVTDALTQREHVFQAPPQPVVCEIETKDGMLAIRGTFAPRVVFKNDEAVEGSPGLANVTGVNAYLAWPVVEYVNRAPGIRHELLRMINAYRARWNGLQAAR